MINSSLAFFFNRTYNDGMYVGLNGPERLLERLNAREDKPSGLNAFLVTSEDSLNELAPVEVLAGEPLKARVGSVNEIHSSQVRIMTLSFPDRLEKILILAQMLDAEKQSEG